MSRQAAVAHIVEDDLNFHQLEELRTQAEHRITEMRETGAPALRDQWGEQAAAIGMTIEEIVEGGNPKGRRPRSYGRRRIRSRLRNT